MTCAQLHAPQETEGTEGRRYNRAVRARSRLRLRRLARRCLTHTALRARGSSSSSGRIVSGGLRRPHRRERAARAPADHSPTGQQQQRLQQQRQYQRQRQRVQRALGQRRRRRQRRQQRPTFPPLTRQRRASEAGQLTPTQLTQLKRRQEFVAQWKANATRRKRKRRENREKRHREREARALQREAGITPPTKQKGDARKRLPPELAARRTILTKKERAAIAGLAGYSTAELKREIARRAAGGSVPKSPADGAASSASGSASASPSGSPKPRAAKSRGRVKKKARYRSPPATAAAAAADVAASAARTPLEEFLAQERAFYERERVFSNRFEENRSSFTQELRDAGRAPGARFDTPEPELYGTAEFPEPAAHLIARPPSERGGATGPDIPDLVVYARLLTNRAGGTKQKFVIPHRRTRNAVSVIETVSLALELGATLRADELHHAARPGAHGEETGALRSVAPLDAVTGESSLDEAEVYTAEGLEKAAWVPFPLAPFPYEHRPVLLSTPTPLRQPRAPRAQKPYPSRADLLSAFLTYVGSIRAKGRLPEGYLSPDDHYTEGDIGNGPRDLATIWVAALRLSAADRYHAGLKRALLAWLNKHRVTEVPQTSWLYNEPEFERLWFVYLEAVSHVAYRRTRLQEVISDWTRWHERAASGVASPGPELPLDPDQIRPELYEEFRGIARRRRKGAEDGIARA